MEIRMKSTVNHHGQYVILTTTNGLVPWYTVYVDDDVKITTRDLYSAERKYELWSS